MAKLPLTNGGVALVDDADLPLVEGRRWFLQRAMGTHAYAATGPSRTRLLMHRVITNAPKGMVVDHINGDGLDNRRCNLRVCTRAENQRNRRHGASTTNPYKGVTLSRHKTRWCARIGTQGAKAKTRRITIGWFDTAEEAAAAYDLVAVLTYGEFACLNFPHVFPEVSRRVA